MAQQNVTLSLPKEVVRQVKHLAVDQGVSLSKFVARLLEERVQAERAQDECAQPTQAYLEARDRELKRMREGLPLGLKDGITWTRESLHER